MKTDWLSKWALYQPEKIALHELETGLSYTYAELNRRANGLLHELRQRGLKPGDRVAMLAEFSLATFSLFAAVQKGGFILVPLNYRLTKPELEYILTDSNPTMLLAEEKYMHQAMQHQVPVESLSVWQEWVGSPDEPESDVSFDAPLFLLYTSGTTGFPKGALYTHRMAFWNSLNTMLRLQLNGSDSTLLCMPSFHTGGWNVLATPLLHVGGTIHILRKFDAGLVLKSLQEDQITQFMTVPTMTRMLAEHEQFQQASFIGIRNYIVGGEALPLALIETWASKGVYIRQGYGLTEAGPNITSLPALDAIRKRGSIGFVNFYVDYRLVNEQGEDAQTLEKGELWLKGDVVSPGYWRNEKANLSAYVGSWFKTGDVLIRDEEGYLFLVDRKKNMFISGGENVYPAEIEKEFRKHEEVVEIAVIPVPDTKWGEVGLAYYTTHHGVALSEEELKQFGKASLASFKVPKYFVHLSSMPHNDAGKLDKLALKGLPFNPQS